MCRDLWLQSNMERVEVDYHPQKKISTFQNIHNMYGHLYTKRMYLFMNFCVDT